MTITLLWSNSDFTTASSDKFTLYVSKRKHLCSEFWNISQWSFRQKSQATTSWCTTRTMLSTCTIWRWNQLFSAVTMVWDHLFSLSWSFLHVVPHRLTSVPFRFIYRDPNPNICHLQAYMVRSRCDSLSMRSGLCGGRTICCRTAPSSCWWRKLAACCRGNSVKINSI